MRESTLRDSVLRDSILRDFVLRNLILRDSVLRNFILRDVILRNSGSASGFAGFESFETGREAGQALSLHGAFLRRNYKEHRIRRKGSGW